MNAEHYNYNEQLAATGLAVISEGHAL